MTQTPATRPHWTSRLAFVLAASGAAVGLGNIWKFPYMAGEHGGSAFVLIYLICVLFIGMPVMIAEMIIGRRGQRNAVSAMDSLSLEAGQSQKWRYVGWLGAMTSLMMLSFYSVVAGWSLAYLYRTWSGVFSHVNAEQVQTVWRDFIASPLEMTLWHTLFMLLTLWVVARGVQSGLEKATKIMMPLLFVILLILVGYATSTDGFAEAVEFLFKPDFSKITPTVIIAAMGHAFFTLAVGVGAMLIYGSYLDENVKLGSAVFTIASLDVLVALLAGLAIFPLIFSNQLSPEAGPGLMFVTLPIAFSQMGGGLFFGGLFFLLLFFAAWTSSISLAEPVVALLHENFKLTRKKASIVVGFVAWFLGLGSLLSFNVWQNAKLFGRFTIFDIAADFSINILLPIGGFCFVFFAAWAMKTSSTKQELNVSKPYYYIWLLLARIVAPISILMILFNAIIQ